MSRTGHLERRVTRGRNGAEEFFQGALLPATAHDDEVVLTRLGQVDDFFQRKTYVDSHLQLFANFLGQVFGQESVHALQGKGLQLDRSGLGKQQIGIVRRRRYVIDGNIGIAKLTQLDGKVECIGS
ncbi:MAG: hypothetical protein KatS3mg029_0641 [Saprospiraceae bacterium]|nr:MAG: hypothetical protein KatS3mg029_0641 [Saprospiraceae bacterium]